MDEEKKWCCELELVLRCLDKSQKIVASQMVLELYDSWLIMGDKRKLFDSTLPINECKYNTSFILKYFLYSEILPPILAHQPSKIRMAH